MMVRIIEVKMTVINKLFILTCPVSDFPTFQLCYHFTTSSIPALQSPSLSLSFRLDLSNSLFLTIHPFLFPTPSPSLSLSLPHFLIPLSLSLSPSILCNCSLLTS